MARAAVLLVPLVILTQCGPVVPPERPLPGSVRNADAPLLLGDRVRRITVSGRPTLQMIRRAGDPMGAMALSVFPAGGSSETLLLSHLLESRLRIADGRLAPESLVFEIRVHDRGFLLAWEVGSPEVAKQWVDSIHRALSEKVTEKEARSLKEGVFLKSALVRVRNASAYRACMGQMGAEGPAALKEAQGRLTASDFVQKMEELRAASVGAGRVGLSALGDPVLLDAVAEAHERDWPVGAAPDDSWTGDRKVGVIESVGGRELRLALRVPDSEAALAGARALRDPIHPLHARLHALDSHMSAGQVEVALRPAGACIGLTIRIDTESPRPSIRSLAEAAIVGQEEIRAALAHSLAKDEVNLAMLSPSGAVEAVALGAWTAVRSARTGGEVQEVVEYQAPPEESLTADELSSTIDETKSRWEGRPLALVTSSEVGQRELWMVLASRCGTSPEPPEEAGLRALTVSTLAKVFDTRHGVRLSPWVGPDAVGLVAHAAPLRGESAEMHATRVARALAGAYAGPPLDGRVVAAMRSSQIERVGNDPADALITQILGGGHPSLVQPWGSEKWIATMSTADVERTRKDLAQEPLRLAVLESSEVDQGGAAQRAISHWLAPLREHIISCGSPSPEPAGPGLWELETIDEHVQEGAYIGVWSPALRHLGRATEFLLNRPGGYLDRALLVPGLAASAEARWMGGPMFGGLALRVSAEPHQMDQAIAQTRALLAKLASGASTDADARLASQRFHRSREAIARTQAGRVVALWLGADPDAAPEVAISGDALRDLHKTLRSDQHRVVKVLRRK